MNHRTRAYWPTRITLAIGVTIAVEATAIAVLFAGEVMEPCFCADPDVLGLPFNVAAVLLMAAGVALGVFGLVWMVRIFLGPRDEPPDWRYRDR